MASHSERLPAVAPHPGDFQAWAREVAGRTEAALLELMPSSRVAPARLHDAMRYSTLGGGKRVRAMLVHAAGPECSVRVDKAPGRCDAAIAAATFSGRSVQKTRRNTAGRIRVVARLGV